MLQITDICKQYKTGNFIQKALNHVSLNLRDNEFVSILGPSGSGKTTLLNIIGGLDNYTDGDLILNGKSTKDFTERDWNSYRNNSIGFIFQSYNLIGHLSIVENVELGMTLSGVSAKEKHEKALEVLKKVGLSDHLHKRPNQLSGGQMQRVAIARALASKPAIVLADEPTGALDSRSSDELLALFSAIHQSGQTIVMVTHSTKAAASAGRVMFIKDGEVFHQLYRGNDTNEQFYQRISDTLTLLTTGGEAR